MKRCPACNRVEPDDKLTFCRADGTSLIIDTGSVPGNENTAKFGAPQSSEIETGILPHSTNASINRGTGPTTVLLPTPTLGTTRDLTKRNRRPLVIAACGLLLVIVAVVGYFFFARKPTTAIESIAVMPFVNQSNNADVEYLSDGMTETLISSLSQLPNLNVKPRSSVFRYKGEETDPQTIAKELGVEAILNGRVVQRGQDLAVIYAGLNDKDQAFEWLNRAYEARSFYLTRLKVETVLDNLRPDRVSRN